MNLKSFLRTQLPAFLLLAGSAHAQTAVQGTVLSAEDKSPLPGATVVVEGTTRGTSAGADGRYALEAVPGEVLVFSFVGFEDRKVTYSNQTTIDVELEPQSNSLDEVVVMGYSSQRKTELSSAVVSLDAEQLTDVTSPDIGNMLQGKAAGVLVYNTSGQPGSQATIRIRGTGSITAASDPLYVVDGIIGGTFNPNDVETLTVLKDAGATAIYGSEGAGGVIVVTTKSAKQGQKTTVNFKFSAGVKSVLQGRLKMMDSEELYYTQKSYMPEVLFQAQRPESLLGQDFDWVDAIFRTGVVQNYYASVSGSSGKTNYYVSLDHYSEDGTLINTDFHRTTARINLSTELARSLRMTTRVAYTNSRDYSSSSYQTLEWAYCMVPWDSPYYADGSLIDLNKDTEHAWLSQYRYNPLFAEKYNYAKSHSDDLVGDLQLVWNPTDWLTVSSSNRFNRSGSKYITCIDPRTVGESEHGSLANSLSEGWGISSSNLVKAAHSFGDHNLGGLVGYEYGINKEEYLDVTGQDMPEGMGSMNSTIPFENGGYDLWGEGWSVFAQVQYSYRNKYTLTASFRADASSKFAPRNRVGYFPSVAASWVVSHENWLRDAAWLDLLKLRASYGETGNSSIGSYLYLDSYSFASKYHNKVTAIPVRKANPYLGWETANMTGVGLDASFLGRIDLTLDFYNIINSELLLNVPLSPSTGFFDQTANAGKVRNRGFEIALNTTNVKTRDVTWTTGFNIGFNRNRVLTTPTPEGFLQSSGGNGTVSQQVKVGQDIYSWYMPKWLGVDPGNGDPVWEKVVYDEHGRVTGRIPTNDYSEATNQVVGVATPKFSGGVSTSLRVFNFTLSGVANFVYGNKIFNNDRLTMDADGAFLTHNSVSLDNGLKWKRWEKPGDVATHPKAVAFGNKNSNAVSSRFLEDGSFFRIKNVTLAYDLPEKWVRKMRMQSMRIYVSGDNLATFTRFSGMDPEVDLQGTEYTLAGMYSTPYPVGRTFMFGVDLTF